MTTITVATLNLHRGAANWLRRRQLIVGQLLDSQPDVVMLQEVATPIRQGQWLRNQLNARLGFNAGRQYTYAQAARTQLLHRFEAVGLLTRLPIISKDSVNLDYQGRVAVRLNLELPSGATVDAVSVQLSSEPHAHEARQEQTMNLLGWLEGRGSVQHRVVAGTFHADPESLAVQRLKNFYSYRSAYEAVNGREPLATYPTSLDYKGDTLAFCQDYIFVSPQVHKVHSARIFCHKSDPENNDLYPSNHVGLISEISVSPAHF